ncbi:MAG: alpha/beta hydrolase-fold protein [Vicinamibacterales bacterium]
MHVEHHHWYSQRLERDLGISVFGHFGRPIVTFPTSGGNEWEYHDQQLISALSDFIEQGRVKFFCINTNSSDSFYNERAHPFRRSWMQRMYDEYLREEIVPFIHHQCRGWQPITTMGASLGAYYAVNALFKHPDLFKACFGLSGVYDMKSFMDGMYDDNFYFNNPIDYLNNLTDAWSYDQLRSCDIHLVTGNGPWENSGPTYQLSAVLRHKGIRHSLDDWGGMGGHDWPYWRHQMREYIATLY